MMIDPKTVQNQIDDLNNQRQRLIAELDSLGTEVLSLYEKLIKAKFQERVELARIAVDEDLNKLNQERPTNDQG